MKNYWLDKKKEEEKKKELENEGNRIDWLEVWSEPMDGVTWIDTIDTINDSNQQWKTLGGFHYVYVDYPKWAAGLWMDLVVI